MRALLTEIKDDPLPNSKGPDTDELILDEITKFIAGAKGLKFADSNLEDYITIEQLADGKSIRINKFDLEEVLPRVDDEGESFLQVNFYSGKKILVTTNLIGFRPLSIFGLDMNRLPKVVTTPDIMNIFEAIQESLCHEDASTEELEVLRKVYDAVVSGGESVGFNLDKERRLFTQIPSQIHPTSA